ncbi:MAG: aldo/keto reductase [Deltaproteobacteria bacterium]
MRSKLALGTAQLGLDYGVANTRGRPSDAEVDRLLTAAFAEHDVRAIDTAPAYGDAEARLGAWFAANGRPEGVTLVTKVGAVGERFDPGEVRRGIEASCAKLGSAPDVLLLHDVADLFRHGGALLDVVTEYVETVGVSVYEPDEIVRARSFERVGAIQYPFNVFDRRVRSAGSLDGMKTFARSALLQGLFVAPPGRVEDADRWVSALSRLADGYGLKVIDLAIAYASEASRAEYVLVGVETSAQLAGVAEAMSQPLELRRLDEIEMSFADVDVSIVDPRRW